MTDTPPSSERWQAAEALIDRWLHGQLATNPTVVGIEEGGPDERLWIARLTGEQKPTFAVWFRLRQRTMHYETYFAPAPVANQAEVYEYVLRRNAGLYGLAFLIGAEDALFLAGQLAVESVEEAELDRVLGSLYAATEASFRTIITMAFPSADTFQ